MKRETTTSIDVIIPARDSAALLRGCLDAVVPQLRPGDRVVVVDDASTDETPAVAEAAGATVVRQAQAGGPYVARQRAAMESEAWALVFTDVRCRPLPGWLESHRALLQEGDAVLSCSNVETVSGPTVASQIAAYQQPFRLEATIEGWHLPYFPTCNLGVRRAAFVAVGGFPEVRSGGDAQLCWRIQTAGLGRLAVSRETYVKWIPRSGFTQLLEQYWRYGRSAATMAEETSAAVPAEDRTTIGRRPDPRNMSRLLRDVARRDVGLRVAIGTVVLGVARLLGLLSTRLGRAS